MTDLCGATAALKGTEIALTETKMVRMTKRVVVKMTRWQ